MRPVPVKVGEGMERLYYSGIESPIGTLWAAATDEGIFQVDFRRPESEFLGSLRSRIDAQKIADPDRFDELRHMMTDYFEGRRVSFDLRLDIRGTEFQKEVWSAIRRIPYGKISSYGRLAEEIGRPRAARAVGNAVGDNPIVIVVPCHRVIRSNGTLGGFGGGPELKRYLLGLEGVIPKAECDSLTALERAYPRNREDLLRFFFE